LGFASRTASLLQILTDAAEKNVEKI